MDERNLRKVGGLLMSRAVILGNGPSLLKSGWLNDLQFATIYGVNKSYEIYPSKIWVTADNASLEDGITYFEDHNWPEKIITTRGALEWIWGEGAWGTMSFKCPLEIWQGAGFSGTLAMRAAAIQGHDEIYLVGFDGGDGKRFHGEDEKGDRSKFGENYTQLRNVIIESFPGTKWYVWDGKEYHRTTVEK